MKESDYIESNRKLWNERTPIHVKSEFYSVDEFKKGKSTLKSIELEELGDVSGKSMLHLQCHFGMDTLSWARLGARVTGIDFSEEAIAYARKLSAEVSIPADFICSNIYDLQKNFTGEFDIVFTSYGVLCWLPDIEKWAEVISHFLKPGGIFYIVEGHPFTIVFDNGDDARELKVGYPGYPYFYSPEPSYFPPGGSGYADKTSKLANPSYEWNHTLADIINSLIGNGLTIKFLHEFPVSNYQLFPFLEKGEDGWWRLPNGQKDIPLLFSLMAQKV
jgi:SAM-dependent methyltransferase